MRIRKRNSETERLAHEITEQSREGWVRRMDLKRITWDYENPLEDELWPARRMAEFFPFVAGDITREDKNLILRYLDQIKLPDERKAIIRIVCGAEKDTD